MKKQALLFLFFMVGNSTSWADAHKKYITERLQIEIGQTKSFLYASKTLLSTNGEGRYSVRNLFDGDATTAWVTEYSNESGNVSDSWQLRIVFDEPVYLRSLSFMNGYQKNNNIYYANQRVKALDIEKVIVGGRTYPLINSIHLKDEIGVQEVSLTDGWVATVNMFKTKELMLNITDVYSGYKYNDLCLSELNIDYSSNTEYEPSVSWDELRNKIIENRRQFTDGWDWVELEQNNYRLFNDFIYYTLMDKKWAYQLFITYKPESVSQSESMKRIYRNAVDTQLKIKDSEN